MAMTIYRGPRYAGTNFHFETWHDGPPPHAGWWNASRFGHQNVWRWWDGEKWYAPIAIDGDPTEATRWVADHQEQIMWTTYWPEKARVPRIAP